MKTIVCGVDRSAGARSSLRVAATLADSSGARLVAVHVLDRVADVVGAAERVASQVLYDEVPDARADARGEFGDVAEHLAAVAREENALMIVLGARSRRRHRPPSRLTALKEMRHRSELQSALSSPTRRR